MAPSLRGVQEQNAKVKANHEKEIPKKKPRHTPASRREATRRERIRVQGIRLAYRSLQSALNLPIRGRPRYLHILQTAINRIRDLQGQIVGTPLVEHEDSTANHTKLVGSHQASHKQCVVKKLESSVIIKMEETDGQFYQDENAEEAGSSGLVYRNL